MIVSGMCDILKKVNQMFDIASDVDASLELLANARQVIGAKSLPRPNPIRESEYNIRREHHSRVERNCFCRSMFQ